MNTEITLKGVPLLREGNSRRRGEISDKTLLNIVAISRGRTIPLMHRDNDIGRVENIHITTKDTVRLCGDLVFTDFDELVTLINEERLHPVVVIRALPGSTLIGLDNVWFTTRDCCDFEDQKPADLSDLRVLVKAIAKSEAPAKPQDDTPHIYAQGMSREDIEKWISEVQFNLTSIRKDETELKEMEANTQLVRLLIEEREKFLSKTIRV
ncbi:hypothetical protein DQ657_27070 [Salmonella enterica]|nr:hypothetical protein [Salmonella enterica]